MQRQTNEIYISQRMKKNSHLYEEFWFDEFLDVLL